MIEEKHLHGKGEFLYDFKHDILMFKIKDREYKKSVELQNFVADIDEEGFVTGAQIFDASKVFGIDKIILKSIVSMGFKSHIENNVITITIKFTSKVRNKQIPRENFTQQIMSQPQPI